MTLTISAISPALPRIFRAVTDRGIERTFVLFPDGYVMSRRESSLPDDGEANVNQYTSMEQLARFGWTVTEWLDGGSADG